MTRITDSPIDTQSSRIVVEPVTRAIARKLWAIVVAAIICCLAGGDAFGQTNRRIPVIFDTDICDDIDDTWALALLLQSDEFNVRLITTAVGNTEAKAKVVAKFLQAVGRSDIPIGIGVQHHKGEHRQTGWAQGYDLASYPGKIHKDGVQAIIDTVTKSATRTADKSRRQITIIAVGPLPNIAEALRREPKIVDKVRFVGMHGSVRRGYGSSEQISAEYNVKAYPKDAQAVFTAGWDMTITPLDTCGIVHLSDEKYKKVFEKNSPLTRALMENYRVWYKQGLLNEKKELTGGELDKQVDQKVNSSSTTLFDTAAIYLAMSSDLVKIEQLPIKVTDDGYTRIEEGAKMVKCATEWKDLGAFEDLLVTRLTK
jgi:inosine-uridine nucleoside N-ribohydrolase